jgi:NTP pyrophosphatase (non-canonical NTP hydrolase)
MKIKHTLASKKDQKPTIRNVDMKKIVHTDSLVSITLFYPELNKNMSYKKSRKGSTWYPFRKGWLFPIEHLPSIGNPKEFEVTVVNTFFEDISKLEKSECVTKFDQIRNWAKDKGIYDKGDVKTQYIKLQEEAGELAKAIMNEDYDEFVDAIGDCIVVLTNLAELGNKFFDTTSEYYEDVVGDGGSKMCFPSTKISIESCIDSAWNEIKDRKGKMQNGTFIKNTL